MRLAQTSVRGKCGGGGGKQAQVLGFDRWSAWAGVLNTDGRGRIPVGQVSRLVLVFTSYVDVCDGQDSYRSAGTDVPSSRGRAN